MANRFSIQPASPMAGLQMLYEGVETRADYERKKAAETELQNKRIEAANIIQTGTPEQISQYAIRNPKIATEIGRAIGFQSDLTRQNMIDSAKRILIGKESPLKVATERAEMVIGQGGDATHTIEYAKQAATDPEGARMEAEKTLALYDPAAFNQYKRTLEPEKGIEVAGIKEFEYLTEGLTPEELAEAKRVKLGLSPRASESAVSRAEKAFAEESGKLKARFNLEPQVAGAVTAAKNEATAMVKEAGQRRSNETAWNVYDSSMQNLAKAMTGTETGAFVGFIPAITANQQIADGAVAVMAPVLKQMFRASGEGTFTDKDQEMLLKMVPTRKDLPEARAAKIKAIDSVVRAKLGIAEETERTQVEPEIIETQTPSEVPATQMTDEELFKIGFGGGQ